jgi:hypothetical protein
LGIKNVRKRKSGKKNADRIIEQAKYRVSMKRKLLQSGIPSSVIRNASTENLETLINVL